MPSRMRFAWFILALQTLMITIIRISPGKIGGLLFVVHMCHLISYVLQPRLGTLAAGYHLCKFRTDNGLRRQWLAKDFPLIRPPV